MRGSTGTPPTGRPNGRLRGLTKIAAIELGPDRIRVNSVHPGAIDTPMIAPYVRRGTDRGAAFPIQRVGLPDDVAQLVLFLASDESSYISGAEITVDGGMHAGRPTPPTRD